MCGNGAGDDYLFSDGIGLEAGFRAIFRLKSVTPTLLDLLQPRDHGRTRLTRGYRTRRRTPSNSSRRPQGTRYPARDTPLFFGRAKRGRSRCSSRHEARASPAWRPGWEVGVQQWSTCVATRGGGRALLFLLLLLFFFFFFFFLLLFLLGGGGAACGGQSSRPHLDRAST